MITEMPDCAYKLIKASSALSLNIAYKHFGIIPSEADLDAMDKILVLVATGDYTFVDHPDVFGAEVDKWQQAGDYEKMAAAIIFHMRTNKE